MKDDLDKHIEEREKKSPGFKKKVEEAVEKRTKTGFDKYVEKRCAESPEFAEELKKAKEKIKTDILASKENCPFCGADLQGEEIPEESREFYGEYTHFSRKIGISNWDSVYEWKCPDCGKTWPREDRPYSGFRTSDVEVKG